MAYYTDPIHGRLKLIIKTSGGYDFDYHMEQEAKRFGVSKDIIIEIYRMTSNKERREKYIELYKNGQSLEYIREVEKIAFNKSMFQFEALLSSLYMINARRF